MMNTTNSSPEVRLALRASEAAKALGISERTLWTLAHERREIRTVRIGRAVLFPTSELERFIASKLEGGTP